MISGLTKGVSQFVTANAPAILTGVGMVGVGATAVLTGRATLISAQLLREEQSEIWTDLRENTKPGDPLVPDNPWDVVLTTKTKIKVVAPHFIAPVLVGAGTIAAIFFSHRISTNKAMALAAAYALSEGRLKEYKTKAEEKLGVKKSEEVLSAVHKAGMEKHQPATVIIGDGEVLCFDAMNGRYFMSSVERLRQAENAINRDLHEHHYSRMTDFYEALGVDGTTMTDHLGWHLMRTGPIEVKFTSEITKDNRPCIAFDFSVAPVSDYTKEYLG